MSGRPNREVTVRLTRGAAELISLSAMHSLELGARDPRPVPGVKFCACCGKRISPKYEMCLSCAGGGK